MHDYEFCYNRKKLETLSALRHLHCCDSSPYTAKSFLTKTILWQRNGAHQEDSRSSSPVPFRRYFQNPSGMFLPFFLFIVRGILICEFAWFWWQVADMHYGIGSITRCRDVLASEFEFCSDLNTTQFLKRIIKAENPDFIAFTGSLLISFGFFCFLFPFLFCEFVVPFFFLFCEFSVFDLFVHLIFSF